ncbi:ABC transporter substrate-binding protein [Rhizobium sp. Leaf391]|uniref:ABC transporter substrate-binding protein n=1 Tax=Rhizobium sp. Leaf391 TaxID=1736360 RepID=UPI0007126DFE|nr:sugar ABC transporter substrate-binding protein [Rhizobium sp. Leaf391]KQT01677.1 ABC transporter substrate-binding protein [Rhizobium sp. Leaf391]
MQRKFLQVAILATSVFGMTALSARAQVSIDFWDQVWGPAPYSQRAESLVEEFNKSQKDIHVTYRSVPWASWYETYVTAIASGSAPDLSTGAGFQAVQFYDMDAIYPVDELVDEMTKDGGAADFAPGSLDAVKYDGHYVALPWAMDVRVLLYRKDLLQAVGAGVPTTWEEFRKTAKAVTREGVYGLVSSGDPNGTHWINTILINNGSGLFDSDRKPNLTSEKSQQALQFLSTLVADGTLDPASAGYKDDDARGRFYSGGAAFYLGSPGTASGAGASKDQIGVVPPLTSTGGEKGTINWVNNIMVYKQTEHPKETLRFLRWWSENQKVLWTEGNAGGIPARQSFQEDPFFSNNAQLNEVIKTYLPVAKPLSATAGGTFPQLNEVEGDGFLTTLVQKIWQGQPAADAVQPAQERLQEIMDK